MREEIGNRLSSLVKEGGELVDGLKSQDDDAWVDDAEIPIYQSWLTASGNLLLAIGGTEFDYFQRLRDIVTTQKNPAGLQIFVVRRAYELLLSALEDLTEGTVRVFEDIVAATLLDDFLDRAARYHDAGRTMESAALASTVFEHVLRRIGTKRGKRFTDKILEPSIANLVAAGLFNDDEGQQVTAYAVIHDRTVAGDAGIESAEVESLIAGTRALIQDFI